MKLLKNERFVAVLLLSFAVFGLILSNTPASDQIQGLKNLELPLVHQLTLSEFVSEFGLAFFFLVIGIELRHEFDHGIFKSPKAALSPTLAAAFGVIVPILSFLLVVGLDSQYTRGWAIPTATDVTFSLAIFALFGGALSRQARSYLLAVVVIDDIIAIVLIAVVFSKNINLQNLLLALICLATIRWLSNTVRPRQLLVVSYATQALLSLAVWFLLLESGIHASIAGVAIAFALPKTKLSQIEQHFSPWVNGLVLPLFAFFSTAIAAQNANVFTPLTIALLTAPLAKLLGISFGGWIGYKIIRASKAESVATRELVAIASLGGIGFTVALLVSKLSFDKPEISEQATLALLITTFVAIVFGALMLKLLSAKQKRIS